MTSQPQPDWPKCQYCNEPKYKVEFTEGPPGFIDSCECYTNILKTQFEVFYDRFKQMPTL